MDSSEDWEEKKDAEKRSRYAHVLEFFNSLQEREGWTMIQFNFTVGVRGSISNVDRTEPLSFTSTLKAFGITSRINLDRIRKVVANRIFEAHDLMLRSYYAVKFGSSSQLDFSRLVGTSFALQHCIRSFIICWGYLAFAVCLRKLSRRPALSVSLVRIMGREFSSFGPQDRHNRQPHTCRHSRIVSEAAGNSGRRAGGADRSAQKQKQDVR